MHLPGDGPLRVLLLFIPCQARPMSVQTCDNIWEPIAIDVVDQHIGSALVCIIATAAEGRRMEYPKSAGRTGGRLLPPASSMNDIDPAVFVDIAATQAVGPPHG